MQRRQSQLTIGFDPRWRRQSGFDVPNDGANLTAAFPATSRNYVEIEETVEDIEDCTGQDILLELITGQLARLTVDFDVDPDLLAGWLAFAYAAAAGPTGGTSEVQTETVTSTAGTRRLYVQTGSNVQRTTALAFNANAAAIQAALNALSNVAPGDITVGQVVGPPIVNTYTFGGALANMDVALIVIEDNTTGGTATMDETTPGVGRSHVITRTATFSLPLLTLYIGFRDSDKPAKVFKNVGVNSIRIRATARGRVTATVELIGSADLDDSVAYTMPECMDILPIRFNDCALFINGTDIIAAGTGREFEYGYNNDIRTGASAFTGAGIDITRLERDDRRPSYINFFEFGEPNDPHHVMALSRPSRTIVEAILRLGPVGRNVTCNVPQGILKTQTPQIRFEEGESQLALQVRPKKVSGDATTPSNLVAFSSLATAYLASA